uniref:Uncharacterized protein n=1 Tax=Lepeophtheirus salmonis TaxID=72036 RepID=A0A0K2USH0_LEPSM
MCLVVVAPDGKNMDSSFCKYNETIEADAYCKVLRWKILH